MRQTMVAGVRKISAAILSGAALVDSASYSGAVVEARAEAANRERRDRHLREFLL